MSWGAGTERQERGDRRQPLQQRRQTAAEIGSQRRFAARPADQTAANSASHVPASVAECVRLAAPENSADGQLCEPGSDPPGDGDRRQSEGAHRLGSANERRRDSEKRVALEALALVE